MYMYTFRLNDFETFGLPSHLEQSELYIYVYIYIYSCGRVALVKIRQTKSQDSRVSTKYLISKITTGLSTILLQWICTFVTPYLFTPESSRPFGMTTIGLAEHNLIECCYY